MCGGTSARDRPHHAVDAHPALRHGCGTTYVPVRPPIGHQNGRVVTPGHWDKIGAIFAKEPWLGETAKLHDEESTHAIQVADARNAATPPSLARNGFELRDSPTTMTDFYDDDAVCATYYVETEALVKQATGAKDAFVFQHMRRDSDALNKESEAHRNTRSLPSHGSVQRVHADYTPANGPAKLQELEDMGIVPAGTGASGRAWSIINVWRNIDSQPIQSLPLAVLDAATVDAETTFTYALVVDEMDPPLVGMNNGVSFSEQHGWYHYPRMTRDEALMFYTFDGTHSPPRFVFHCAFDDGHGAMAPPRKSIECRCLVLF